MGVRHQQKSQSAAVDWCGDGSGKKTARCAWFRVRVVLGPGTSSVAVVTVLPLPPWTLGGLLSNSTARLLSGLVASQLSALCLCVCCRRLSGHKPFPFFFLPTRRPRYAINLLQGPVGLELWPAFSLNSAIFCRGLLLGLHAGSRYRLIVRTLTCYAIRYYLSHSPCSPSSH